VRARPALLLPWGAGALLGLAGCSRGDAAYVVQHAEVDVAADGSLSGYQVWEFYTRAWKRSRADDHHLCARVQALAGAVSADPAGCEGCVASYAVTTTEVESDCDTALAGQASYAAVNLLAIGEVPAEIEGEDPYPGRSLGWYQSFDGQSAEPMGFAWNNDLGTGADGGVPPGWNTGTRYVLWPAWAWEL
jgi:hypothetical protein